VAVDPEKTVEGFDAAIAESAFDAAAFRAYRDFLRTLVSSRRSPGIAEVMKFPSIAGRMFPRSMIDAGKEPTDTVLVVRLESPLHDRGDRERTIGALTNAVRPFPGVTVAGLAAVSNELEEATRTGLAQSVALSIGLVLAWLLIVFRRPMDVLLALVPLLFAGVTTVLFMVAANQRFNPINSVAIPLLDGIAVDAGVFLVSVARTHASREELRKALRATTHAVLLAVSTTVTGFGALCFTHTPAIRSLGMVAAVGITASMLGALFVLMPILIWRASDRRSV
jgi:predicted RND superfamily exporter protein